MLNTLFLKNFLLVKNTTIQFGEQVSVLTGETGAGKSILINALSLVLGSRGSSSWVRQGSEKSEIVAHFINLPETVIQLTSDLEIDTDNDSLLFKRILFLNGKSKSFINDVPVTIKTLKLIGEKLVDIYGQHSHYALLNNDIQRDKLDLFGNYQNELSEIKKLYQVWQKNKKLLNELQSNLQNSIDRQTLLNYHLEEFNNLNIQEQEFELLEQTQSKLSQSEVIKQELHEAREILHNNEHSAIYAIESSLVSLQKFIPNYPQLTNTCTILEEVSTQLTDAINEIRDLQSIIQHNPELLEKTEIRLGILFDLARKHNCSPNNLSTIQQEIQQEFDQINSDNSAINKLKLEIDLIWQKIQDIANKITSYRSTNSVKLAKIISQQINNLGMTGASIKIKLKPLANNSINAFGQEQIEFYVETNPGLGFNPLNKSASGGELSRIGLAVQVCTKHLGSQAPTIIMDEVDAGIGGETANKVGEVLEQMAQHSQVLCVTHLPQIARIGKQHIKVSKTMDGSTIHHSITSLDHEQKIAEIARMLGGSKVTPQIIKSAKEMLL